MVILHFANVWKSKLSGVPVVVTKHIIMQQKSEEVAFVNIKDVKVADIEHQFEYSKQFNIDSLPAPFNKPDIVVFHETYRVKYLRIYPSLIKKKIPYIIIPHGELRKEAQRHKRIKKTIANILLFKRFINNAAAVQCLSEKEKEATLLAKKKFIATNGVMVPPNQKITFNTEKTEFVFIGRLDIRVKGLDFLISAVKSKAEILRQNNAVFNIYGPDLCGSFSDIEKIIKENKVEDIIKLNHEVVDEEKERILLDADVFIQTSRHEGMPMGILEALSYGVPCLVTKGTSLAEFINENNCGWGCETTADDIAQKLETIIAEKETLQQKSVAARQAIENNFAWDKVSKQTVEYYKNLCR